jgi:polar amino acid transport system permease protein
MEQFLAEVWIARRQLAEGMLATLEISAASIAIGSAIGLGVGVGLCFAPKPLRLLLRAYVDLVRGTPVLVLILAAFYILAVMGLPLGAAQAGILALSVFCGAHLGEILRGALQAVPLTQIESARSLGLGTWRLLGLVLLPQAIRQVIPVWVNTATEIVKASTLLSVIGVGELLLKTQEVIGRNYLTLEFYALAGLAYFLVNRAIQAVGQCAERRFEIP